MAELYTAKELRGKNLEELQKLLAARREKVRHVRFLVAGRGVKDHRELRFLRREVARILTIIRQLKNEAPV